LRAWSSVLERGYYPINQHVFGQRIKILNYSRDREILCGSRHDAVNTALYRNAVMTLDLGQKVSWRNRGVIHSPEGTEEKCVKYGRYS
jgi:hypothetical protein